MDFLNGPLIVFDHIPCEAPLSAHCCRRRWLGVYIIYSANTISSRRWSAPAILSMMNRTYLISRQMFLQ